MKIAGECAATFIIKSKDDPVEFHTDFILPELVVFRYFFNGTACYGNALVVHLAMVF